MVNNAVKCGRSLWILDVSHLLAAGIATICFRIIVFHHFGIVCFPFILVPWCSPFASQCVNGTERGFLTSFPTLFHQLTYFDTNYFGVTSQGAAPPSHILICPNLLVKWYILLNGISVRYVQRQKLQFEYRNLSLKQDLIFPLGTALRVQELMR